MTLLQQQDSAGGLSLAEGLESEISATPTVWPMDDFT